MEEALRAFAKGDSSGPLQITYSDMHGLWGGVTVSLTHEGEYELATSKGGSRPTVQRRLLPVSDVVSVARLLVTLEAWVQRVPERMPVPDESRAHLTVQSGCGAVSIWERVRELARHGRLSQVRDLLLGFAPDTA